MKLLWNYNANCCDKQTTSSRMNRCRCATCNMQPATRNMEAGRDTNEYGKISIKYLPCTPSPLASLYGISLPHCAWCIKKALKLAYYTLFAFILICSPLCLSLPRSRCFSLLRSSCVAFSSSQMPQSRKQSQWNPRQRQLSQRPNWHPASRSPRVKPKNAIPRIKQVSECKVGQKELRSGGNWGDKHRER